MCFRHQRQLSSFSPDDHMPATLSKLTVLGNRFGGMSNAVKGEGTHFKLPWLQRPYIYNVRSTPRNIKSITGSRDLQMIDINLRIIYRPQVDKLPEMYRTLGLDYDERLSLFFPRHPALSEPNRPCSPARPSRTHALHTSMRRTVSRCWPLRLKSFAFRDGWWRGGVLRTVFTCRERVEW